MRPFLMPCGSSLIHLLRDSPGPLRLGAVGAELGGYLGTKSPISALRA